MSKQEQEDIGYFRQMQEGVKTRDVYPMLHVSRVLVAGTIYHLTLNRLRGE